MLSRLSTGRLRFVALLLAVMSLFLLVTPSFAWEYNLDGEVVYTGLAARVVLANGTMYIGDHRYDTPQTDAGIILLYNRDVNGDWVQTDTVQPAVTGASALFGTQLDIDSNGVIASIDNQSNLYVFQPDGGGNFTETKITLPGIPSSLAIDDGVIALGYPYSNGSFGEARVYSPDGIGGYTFTTLTASGGAANDQFGFDVDIEDGVVVVGAIETSPEKGKAYVYKPNGVGVYTETILNGTGLTDGAQFGQAITISSSVVYVGAPAYSSNTGRVFVFTPAGASYTETFISSPGYSNNLFSIDISVDGDVMAVGMGWSGPINKQGAVIMYLRNGSTWTLDDTLYETPGGNWCTFGSSVSTAGAGYVAAPSCRGVSIFNNVPDAPVIEAVANGSTQIDVTWNAVYGAMSYTLESSLNGSSWSVVASGLNTPSYNHTSLTCGTEYYYRVIAVGSRGNSAPSGLSIATTDACSVTPNAPVISAAANGQNQIDITWSAVANATSYTLERSSDGASWSQHAAGLTGISYSDTGLACASMYYYRLSAVGAGGTSAPSNVASATTDTCSSAGIELLRNRGFEAKKASSDIKHAPWKRANVTNDTIACNLNIQSAVAHTGECAFRFKGSQSELSAISQRAKISGITFAAGGQLNLSAWVKAPGVSAQGKIIVKVIYSDATARTKVKQNITQTSGYQEVVVNATLASSAVSRIVVIVRNTSPDGRLYVDDTSLIYEAPSALIALPR